MVTQVNFDTFAQVTGGQVGTAPAIFVGTTDQLEATLLVSGAFADLYSAGIIKARDVMYLNYDVDGTPGQNVYTVTATSGGSIITYPESVGGALLAANNLDDVNSVSTSRHNLGLGTDQNVVFLSVYAGASGAAGVVRSYPSAATSGYLGLIGVANGGDYGVNISNASHGQATLYTINDVGASTGQFLVKTAALVDANFVAASGTAGKCVDSGYNVDNVLLYASVAITATQFKALYSAPKLIVAAPGANKLIVVDRIELLMTYVSAAYAAGGVVGFQYDTTVHGAGAPASSTEAAADFQAAASTGFMFNGNAGNTVGVVPFSTSVNKGLYLSCLTADFTTGDSTFVCKVHYRIVATA